MLLVLTASRSAPSRFDGAVTYRLTYPHGWVTEATIVQAGSRLREDAETGVVSPVAVSMMPAMCDLEPEGEVR